MKIRISIFPHVSIRTIVDETSKNRDKDSQKERERERERERGCIIQKLERAHCKFGFSFNFASTTFPR